MQCSGITLLEVRTIKGLRLFGRKTKYNRETYLSRHERLGNHSINTRNKHDKTILVDYSFYLF